MLFLPAIVQGDSMLKGHCLRMTQSSSPTRQKPQVTFAEGRAPSLTGESPEHDARADEASQLPLPTW